MKQIAKVIEQVEYTTYTYDTIEEKESHITQMKQQGYELLDNFEHKHEVVFRKFLDTWH